MRLTPPQRGPCYITNDRDYRRRVEGMAQTIVWAIVITFLFQYVFFFILFHYTTN
jgi:hypothetical protein